MRDAIAAAARFQGARGRLGGVAADIALACGAGGGTRLAAGLVTAYIDWGLGAAPLDFLGLLPRPLSGCVPRSARTERQMACMACMQQTGLACVAPAPY